MKLSAQSVYDLGQPVLHAGPGSQLLASSMQCMLPEHLKLVVAFLLFSFMHRICF